VVRGKQPSVEPNFTELRPTQLRAYGTQTSAKHGTNKRQRCVRCQLVMKLTRREAHPSHGPSHELQTFICGKCGGVVQASVASPGADPGAP